MTTKLLSLLLTIAATACTQMANACAGTEPDAPPESPKSGKRAAKAVVPEPEEEEVEVDTEEETEDDGVDYDELRNGAKAALFKLFERRPELKPPVQALLKKFGAKSTTELEDDKVQPFIDAVLKLKNSSK